MSEEKHPYKSGQALTPEQKRKRFYEDYLKREATMDQVYQQTLRVTQELLSRIESEMFRGMQYKAKENPSFSAFDAKLTKAAEGLGKLVNQLQSTHLRLLKEGEKQAQNMSREEQMDYVVKFVKKLPKGYQKVLFDNLAQALGYRSLFSG